MDILLIVLSAVLAVAAVILGRPPHKRWVNGARNQGMPVKTPGQREIERLDKMTDNEILAEIIDKDIKARGQSMPRGNG